MAYPVRHWYWPSSFAFVFASMAAALGLAGFWRLPYLLHTYGGGAFVLAYLAAIVLLGLPLLAGQLLMARGCSLDVPGIFSRWTRAGDHSRFWVWIGGLTVISALFLLASYGVLGGWLLAYILRCAAGMFNGIGLDTAREQFNNFAVNTEANFGWHLVFIGVLVLVTARGARAGVGPALRYLAWLLVISIIALLVWVYRQPSQWALLGQFLAVDFTALSWKGVLEALFQAFFSLSLGTGVFFALGRYLPQKAPVMRQAGAIVVLHSVVLFAIVIALVPLMANTEQWLGDGVASLFINLPFLVQSQAILVLCFVLLLLACLAGSIALLELVVQVVEQRRHITRLRACLYAVSWVWLLGLVGLLSFGVLSSIFWHGVNFFNGMLLVDTQALLPLTGLALCLLLGRVLTPETLWQAWCENPMSTGRGFKLWHGVMRYPARILMIVVAAYALGAESFIRWLWSF